MFSQPSNQGSGAIFLDQETSILPDDFIAQNHSEYDKLGLDLLLEP